MEALLFALQVGNESSHVEIWEDMELFIDVNFPGDLDLIQTVPAVPWAGVAQGSCQPSHSSMPADHFRV